jgi:hypothetical protein
MSTYSERIAKANEIINGCKLQIDNLEQLKYSLTQDEQHLMFEAQGIKKEEFLQFNKDDVRNFTIAYEVAKSRGEITLHLGVVELLTDYVGDMVAYYREHTQIGYTGLGCGVKGKAGE